MDRERRIQRRNADKIRSEERKRNRRRKHEDVAIEAALDRQIALQEELASEEVKVQVEQEKLEAELDAREEEWIRERDSMLKMLQQQYPEAFFKDSQPESQWLDAFERLMPGITVENFLEQHGFVPSEIGLEKVSDDIYRLQAVPMTEIGVDPLPIGYGLKGGSARALLERTLNLDPDASTRDIDVIRIPLDRDYEEQDTEVSKKYMPDDYQQGHGVEVITSVQAYLDSRDFTINEVLVYGDILYVTRACILDTVRHIVRVTDFEKRKATQLSWEDGIGDKILSKMLRFRIQLLKKYSNAKIEDAPSLLLERRQIRPFYLALQLDRAYEMGINIAEQYVRELVILGQLPPVIRTAEQAVDYLLEHVYNFSFSHVPIDDVIHEYESYED